LDIFALSPPTWGIQHDWFRVEDPDEIRRARGWRVSSMVLISRSQEVENDLSENADLGSRFQDEGFGFRFQGSGFRVEG
jgi:hypothetical protein